MSQFHNSRTTNYKSTLKITCFLLAHYFYSIIKKKKKPTIFKNVAARALYKILQEHSIKPWKESPELPKGCRIRTHTQPVFHPHSFRDSEQ